MKGKVFYGKQTIQELKKNHIKIQKNLLVGVQQKKVSKDFEDFLIKDLLGSLLNKVAINVFTRSPGKKLIKQSTEIMQNYRGS